jgi:hypothetical protein
VVAEESLELLVALAAVVDTKAVLVVQEQLRKDLAAAQDR